MGKERTMRNLMLFATAAAAMLVQPSAVSADELRAPGGGTIRALVVGIDVYSRLPATAQLEGARADAEDIAQALSRDGVKPVVLFDADVTRAKIVAQMDSFVAESRPGDFVLFAYAGHGMQTPEYPQWQGINADGANEQIALSGFNFKGEGVDEVIVNPEIRAWLSRLDGKGVDALVIMDSCFGGGMRAVDPRTGAIRTRVLRASAEQIRAGEDERANFVGIPMTEKEARADVELMSHVTFLAGATNKSVVPETPGLADSPRGALSFYFARALGGKSAKDGVITRQALFDYLKPNVRGATQDRQLIQVEPQSPEASVYSKPVLTFAEATPAAQASNTPPAPGNGSSTDDSAPPAAQASNTPPPPGNGPPPDQGQAPKPPAIDVPLPPGYGPSPALPAQASNAPPAPANAPPPDQAPTPPPQASNTPPPASGPPADQATRPPSQAISIPLPPGYGPSSQVAPRTDTIRVALINATDKAWDTIEKGNAPFERSPTVDGADLVWDVGKKEVLSRGDLVMQFVDGSLIGGVIDRTWAVRRLREIGENRNLSIQLASEGQLLTAGDVAQIEVDGIANQRLVVFDIAADATVQMLYPSAPGAAGHCADAKVNGWRCSLRVTPPFGADTIVTLATSAPTDDLLRWMRGHHAMRDGALIPDLLANAMKTDPEARIGLVGVYTNKRLN
jgi:hypothetical protein